MEVNYTPKACKGTPENPAKFSGTITLRKPTFDEKYQYIEECGLGITEGGEVENKNIPKQMAAVRKLVKFSKPHYIKVDLMKVETGEKIDSFDFLETDDDCHPILIEIAMAILTGFRVGNA